VQFFHPRIWEQKLFSHKRAQWAHHHNLKLFVLLVVPLKRHCGKSLTKTTLCYEMKLRTSQHDHFISIIHCELFLHCMINRWLLSFSLYFWHVVLELSSNTKNASWKTGEKDGPHPLTTPAAMNAYGYATHVELDSRRDSIVSIATHSSTELQMHVRRKMNGCNVSNVRLLFIIMVMINSMANLCVVTVIRIYAWRFKIFIGTHSWTHVSCVQHMNAGDSKMSNAKPVFICASCQSKQQASNCNNSVSAISSSASKKKRSRSTNSQLETPQKAEIHRSNASSSSESNVAD